MHRRSTRRSRLAGALLAGSFVAASAAVAYAATIHVLAAERPPLPPRLLAQRLPADAQLIALTLTRNWKKVTVERSIGEVTWRPSIWREMHFDDWDRLPADIRRRGLTRMRYRFASVAAGPIAWSTMDAADWDAVPQPIRMVVFPLLIEYWVDEHGTGRDFCLPSDLLVDTVSAIVMAESWFEHRADVVNQWGNRDMGLGQCSNRCRRDLGEMADAGLIDFKLGDEDYLNPWYSTWAAVVWFGLELARAGGDVDLAIRAYHRGFEAAAKGDGEEYLNNVQRLRRKYFGQKPERSPTWQQLAAWARSNVPRRAEGQPIAALLDGDGHLEQRSPERDTSPERQLVSATAPAMMAERDDTTEPATNSGLVGGRTR